MQHILALSLILLATITYCAESPIMQRIETFITEHNLATTPPHDIPEASFQDSDLHELEAMAKEMNQRQSILQLNNASLKKINELPKEEQTALLLKCALYIAERINFDMVSDEYYLHIIDLGEMTQHSKNSRVKICIVTQLIAALKDPKHKSSEIILKNFLEDIGYIENSKESSPESLQRKLSFMKEIIAILPNAKENLKDELYTIPFLTKIQCVNTADRSRWRCLNPNIGRMISLCKKYAHHSSIAAHKIAHAAYDLFDEITCTKES